MAALNFPANPSLNDFFVANGRRWQWNGTAWQRIPDPGAQGLQGPQGVQGASGSGSPGSQGSQGIQGHQGVQGAQGAGAGSQGVQGAVGSQGAQGAAGQQGIQGHQGVQGASGTGSPGSQGNQGHQGIQGIQGVQGADGNFGGVTFDYTFNTITTDSDPGQGKLRISEGIFSGALTLFIDDEDVNGDDISSYLQTIDDSTSTLKGHFRITNKANSDDFAIFSITGSNTDGGTYFKVCATYLSGSTSFSNNEDILITFARTGDKGDAGAQGNQGHQGVQVLVGKETRVVCYINLILELILLVAGIGQVRFDSATFSNITTIGIHNTDADGNDLEDYIATWDDGRANNDKGTVVIKSNTNGDTTFAIFTITSSNTSTIIGTNARFSVTPLNGNIPECI